MPMTPSPLQRPGHLWGTLEGPSAPSTMVCAHSLATEMPSWPQVSTDLMSCNVASHVHVIGWPSAALGPWDPRRWYEPDKIPPQGCVTYTLPPLASDPEWPFVLAGWLSCALPDRHD